MERDQQETAAAQEAQRELDERRPRSNSSQRSRERTSATMATQEQVQEALQRLQAQEAHITTLEMQVQIEHTRAQPAELERSSLIQTLATMRQDRGGNMVDTKGIRKLCAYLISFTTDAPNRIARNAGEGNGTEAWRRLHGEYDPTSCTRRVAVLQQVQNPPRCQRVEDLGSALQDWLSKERQHEMFTDRDGRPCQAQDDSLVAAMFWLMPKSLEETVMFTNEDEGFQELYDELLAYSSTKQSVKVSESKRRARDVDALSRGKTKGKGKKGPGASGKGNKDQNHMSDVRCWNCGRFGHWREVGGKSKGGNGKDGKGKGKLHIVESI